MFFTGVSPSGGASNIWCVILGGNLDLSIAMTTISTFSAFGKWNEIFGPYVRAILFHNLCFVRSYDASVDFHSRTCHFRSGQFGCAIYSHCIIRRRLDHSIGNRLAAATTLSTCGQSTCAHLEIVFIVADSLHRYIRNLHEFVSVSVVHMAGAFQVFIRTLSCDTYGQFHVHTF